MARHGARVTWSHPQSVFTRATFPQRRTGPRVYRGPGALRAHAPACTVAHVMEATWPAHHAPVDDAWCDAVAQWTHPALLVTLVRQTGHGRRITTARVILMDRPLTAEDRCAMHRAVGARDWWDVMPGDTFAG